MREPSISQLPSTLRPKAGGKSFSFMVGLPFSLPGIAAVPPERLSRHEVTEWLEAETRAFLRPLLMRKSSGYSGPVITICEAEEVPGATFITDDPLLAEILEKKHS